MKNVILDPPGNTAELPSMIDEADCTNPIRLRRERQLSEQHVCAINHSLEKIITGSLEERGGNL